MTPLFGWKVAVASAAGPAHRVARLACQDRVDARLVPGPQGTSLIAIVSDGCGGADSGGEGARIATAVLKQLMTDHLKRGRTVARLKRSVVLRWIDRVVAALKAGAAEDGFPTDEYACTLLGAIIGYDASAFFQIGDGAIVVGEGASWSPVFWPQHHEYVNSTNFVTDKNAVTALDFEVRAGRVHEVALFTDGLEQLLLVPESRSVHQPFFEQVFSPVRDSVEDGFDLHLSQMLATYLEKPLVSSRTTDDTTLILATRAREELHVADTAVR